MNSTYDAPDCITKNTIKKSDNTSDQVEQTLIQRLLQAVFCEKLLPYSIQDNTLYILFNRLNKTIALHDVQFFNLGKFKVNGKMTLIDHDQSTPLQSIQSLLHLFSLELTDLVESENWKVFFDEIINCMENELLVKHFIKKFNIHFTAEINKSSQRSFLEYITTHYSIHEQFIFFEAWATQGHPYHPCHKTKLGFSQNDYLHYSPEFNQDVHLLLAAIEKSCMHYESEQNDLRYHDWFAMTFPQHWNDFQKKLNIHGFSVDDYYPIFIHPWQCDNIITTLFHSLIETKKLLLFRDITLETKPSLSFRTLIIKNNCKNPHIKIPVAVHSTSALRTNSPSSAENAPRLTKILREISIQENQFNQRLKLAYENIGLHLKHPDPDVAKHLGIIYRENPAHLITEHQLPIVVAALFEKSPVTHLPLFIELVQACMGDDSLLSALNYFKHYCQIVIPPYLNLLLTYGIALEGHQQNTIAVFDRYRPICMIARDLSGLRIHLPTLQKKGFYFTAYPDSEIIKNDQREVTNKFLHTVIQYHLGEIVLLLTQHYSTTENIFWKIIKTIIEASFTELQANIDPERWQQEYSAILENDWQIKGLLRMRLNNLSKKYIYIYQNNPLREEKS